MVSFMFQGSFLPQFLQSKKAQVEVMSRPLPMSPRLEEEGLLHPCPSRGGALPGAFDPIIP